MRMGDQKFLIMEPPILGLVHSFGGRFFAPPLFRRGERRNKKRVGSRHGRYCHVWRHQ